MAACQQSQDCDSFSAWLGSRKGFHSCSFPPLGFVVLCMFDRWYIFPRKIVLERDGADVPTNQRVNFDFLSVVGDRSNQCPSGFALDSVGPFCAGKYRNK